MRTVLGSVALSVGGFLLLATFLTVMKFPGVPLWIKVASGGLAVVLIIASFLLLRGKKGEPSGRGRTFIVVLSLVTGLAGFIFAIASKNHELGKYCGIEGRGQSYKLTVRIFATILHEESGPAVERPDAGNTIIGPSQELETKMVRWEFGLDAALVACGAFLGGLVGVVILQLTKSRRQSIHQRSDS